MATQIIRDLVLFDLQSKAISTPNKSIITIVNAASKGVLLIAEEYAISEGDEGALDSSARPRRCFKQRLRYTRVFAVVNKHARVLYTREQYLRYCNQHGM